MSKSHANLNLSRNTFILLLNNGGGALLSFALSVLIGRAAGESGLGVYATALAWVYPLSLVAEFGLGTLITREVAHDSASAPDLLHVSSLTRLLIGGSLTLALILLAPLLTHDPTLVRGLQLSAPMIVIVPFAGAFTAVFRAHQAMWPVLWLNLGMLAAQVVLTALVFLTSGGVLLALAVNTFTSAGQLVAAWVIYRTGFVSVGTRSALSVSIKNLLRRASPFAIAAVLAAVQLRVGVLMLEAASGITQVGYFAAASRFTDAARMIPNALFGALLPALSAQSISSSLFTRIMLGLTLYSLAVFVVVALFAPAIIHFTFGDDFAPAGLPLVLLSLSLLPSLLRSARTLYWYAQGREAYVNSATAVMLIAQIAFTYVALNVFKGGASGLALAILLAETVGLILLRFRLN